MDNERKLRRPQEPNFPYPYLEGEVTFQNKEDGVSLFGTLTLPKSEGASPAIVLLHGSDPFDRDSTVFDHKPFLVWSDFITRQGIAVLRFDKRGAGKSDGNYNSSDLEDFANDAIAGIEYLKTRKEIDPQKIGVMGHSEGGMTGVLAAIRSQDIAFVVLMASPCVNWEELIYTQEKLLQRVDGVENVTIERIHNIRKSIFNLLKKEKDRAKAEPLFRDLLKKEFSKLFPLEKKVAEAYYGSEEMQVQFWNSKWFRYNFHCDPSQILNKLQIPVLALNGNKDFVVCREQNLTRIEQTLKAHNHPDYTIIEVPDLNHMFQNCKTGSFTEVSEIEETTAPHVLKRISEWILARTN